MVCNITAIVLLLSSSSSSIFLVVGCSVVDVSRGGSFRFNIIVVSCCGSFRFNVIVVSCCGSFRFKVPIQNRVHSRYGRIFSSCCQRRDKIRSMRWTLILSRRWQYEEKICDMWFKNDHHGGDHGGVLFYDFLLWGLSFWSQVPRESKKVLFMGWFMTPFGHEFFHYLYGGRT
jgi:hypothetical protein